MICQGKSILMKIIIIIFAFLLNISGLWAQSNQSPPMLLKDSSDCTYLLWQVHLYPLSSAIMASNDSSMSIISGNLTGLQTNSSLVNAEGFRIQAIRVLDTLNNGYPLKNTIYPVPIFHLSDSNDNIVKSYDSLFYLGKVDIDSTAKVKVVLRNAGTSKLNLPKGFFYDKQSKTLLQSNNLDSIYILRNDEIWNKEIQWQLRQNKEQSDGESLKYAAKEFDYLESSLNPGDTTSFYIDIRPTIVGLKRDSLIFTYFDGLQRDSALIPMSVTSTWALNYEISNSRTKPSTPSQTNEFIDTIYMFNNKDTRTRITSMRMGINFNPRNVMIKEFVIDTTIFPDGWSHNVVNIDSTEKYGKIFFTAQAEQNQALNQTATSPDELSYFKEASNGKVILGYIKGIQLLGTSDTTEFSIDTSFSQHNYSKELVFSKDLDNVANKIPYIKSFSGKNIADSLIFLNKLLLNSKEPTALIENIYPNPIGRTNSDLQVVVNVLKDNTKVKLKIIDIISGKILIESDEIIYNKGLSTIPIQITELFSGTNVVVMTTYSNIDVWLVNVIK